MNRDTLVGVVGTVVLVAAMIGIFEYSGERAARLDGDPSDWVLTTTEGPTLSATTAREATTTETLEVNRTDLTAVSFTVTWTAEQGANTVRLRVTPPPESGLRSSGNPAEGDAGRLTVAFPVGNANPAEAPDGPGQTTGTGRWKVDVTFVRATGLQEVPVVGPVQGDEEVSWTLETELSHFAPRGE